MSIPRIIGSIDHYVMVNRSAIMLSDLRFQTKRSWFISLSGDDVFDEIKLLFPYQEVNKLEYDDIVKKLKTRFDKTDPILIKRYHFYNRSQGAMNLVKILFCLLNFWLKDGCTFKD